MIAQKSSPQSGEERIKGLGKRNISDRQYTQRNLFSKDSSITPDLSGLEHALNNKMALIIKRDTQRIYLKPHRVIGTTAYITNKVTIITRYISRTLTTEDFELIAETLKRSTNG